MAARKKDANRKDLLAHDNVPESYHAWMVSDGVVEHLIETASFPDAEERIRAVAERLGKGAEIFEVIGRATVARAPRQRAKEIS